MLSPAETKMSIATFQPRAGLGDTRFPTCSTNSERIYASFLYRMPLAGRKAYIGQRLACRTHQVSAETTTLPDMVVSAEKDKIINPPARSISRSTGTAKLRFCLE
ncbi:hypothetical protein HDU91_002363 [Kappamyces sp. JEL0680]|nr:hypothetical protein HDU91_002363 [Kappamyces sp. JEL0680]